MTSSTLEKKRLLIAQTSSCAIELYELANDPITYTQEECDRWRYLGDSAASKTARLIKAYFADDLETEIVQAMKTIEDINKRLIEELEGQRRTAQNVQDIATFLSILERLLSLAAGIPLH
jgi:hypothetical protein